MNKYLQKVWDYVTLKTPAPKEPVKKDKVYKLAWNMRLTTGEDITHKYTLVNPTDEELDKKAKDIKRDLSELSSKLEKAKKNGTDYIYWSSISFKRLEFKICYYTYKEE